MKYHHRKPQARRSRATPYVYINDDDDADVKGRKLWKLTNAQLKEICKSHGLKVSGNKSQLVERLGGNAESGEEQQLVTRGNKLLMAALHRERAQWHEQAKHLSIQQSEFLDFSDEKRFREYDHTFVLNEEIFLDAANNFHGTVKALVIYYTTAINDHILAELGKVLGSTLEFLIIRESFDAISNEGFEQFAKLCPHLRGIHLVYCNITSEGLDKMLSRTPNLEFLYLDGMLRVGDNDWKNNLSTKCPKLHNMEVDCSNFIGLPKKEKQQVHVEYDKVLEQSIESDKKQKEESEKENKKENEKEKESEKENKKESEKEKASEKDKEKGGHSPVIVRFAC